MGMFLRRGIPNNRVFDVSMTWSFSNSDENNYVTIDGVKYLRKSTVSVKAGTLVKVTARGTASATISHDGITVVTGDANKSISYTFALRGNTNIAYTSSPSVKATITTS